MDFGGTPSYEGMNFPLMGIEVEYEVQALLPLLTWTKNQGLDTAKEPALDIKSWAWTGRFIIEATSKGNETKGDKAAIKVIKPWTLFLDLLR